MNNIYIEQANSTDAKRILNIQKLAFLSEAEIYEDYTIPPLVQTLDSLKSDFENCIFYVAKLNEVIVGSVNLRIVGDTGFIGRLVVDPDMQNQGIGTMLMDHVESGHTQLQVFEIFTGNKSAQNIAFYSKRGYREIKRQHQHEKLILVYMQKRR